MADDADNDHIPLDQKRGPGRMPGSGKVPGSGRRIGVPNKVNADLRALILQRGKPIELLCDVARGMKVRVGPPAGPGEPTYHYPSFAERTAAARDLLKYCIPQLQAVQLTGTDAGPIKFEVEHSSRDLARALLQMVYDENVSGNTLTGK